MLKTREGERQGRRGWRGVLRRLLLLGLRPERVAHGLPLAERPVHNARTQRLELRGQRGQTLVAWLIRPDSPAEVPSAVPVVIALHGWGANASTLWPLVAPVVEAGLAVLLFDAACHGDSSDEAFTSLPRFADDLATIQQALATQPGVNPAQVALLGHSVGAAAVLLHASRCADVRAVVCLSAFAHPREVMTRWLHAHGMRWRWMGEQVLEEVQHTIGARFDDIAPENRASQVQAPVLLVHGAQDRVVPVSDAARLLAQLRRGDCLIVDGDHELAQLPVQHGHHIVAFLRHHLTLPGPVPDHDHRAMERTDAA